AGRNVRQNGQDLNVAAIPSASRCCRESVPPPPLALGRKKLAAFSALGGGFLRFPIGDRRCNRTRASASKRPATRAQAPTSGWKRRFSKRPSNMPQGQKKQLRQNGKDPARRYRLLERAQSFSPFNSF